MIKMSKGISLWNTGFQTSLETFKNSEMDSFFVFAEILVVFQLVSYYSFLSTVGVIK
jgi:hypothetical protein